MIDKRVKNLAEAVAGVRDGSVVLCAGFGAVGQPNALIEGLIEQGAKDLTIVANNAGTGRVGLAKLMELGRVRKIICSFPRSAGSVVFEELFRAGKLELEIVPQGTLAERMRAAGAGVPAFYTPTAVGTRLAEGKEERSFNGKRYILEQSLPGDVALVEAWQADRWGNLTYRSSGRNFNPVMAMAGKMTVVQTQHMVDLGELGAIGGGGEEGRHAGAGGAHAFGERALRGDFQLDFSGFVEGFKNDRIGGTRERTDDLAHPAQFHQPRQADMADAGIVGHRDEVFRALLDQPVDKLVRLADGAEAADQHRGAILDARHGVRHGLHDLVDHALRFLRAFPSVALGQPISEHLHFGIGH
jgi:3-oxoadipate CoA-transferase, alpha subunit